MKITVDYAEQNSLQEQVTIDSARYVSDYTIHITFNNGKERVVDFSAFLMKSLHPSIKKYLDKHLFSQFSLVDGNLNWNNYDLIFPIADLYHGQVM